MTATSEEGRAALMGSRDRSHRPLAGLALQPDALVLRLACAVVMTVVWLWHRSR